jgi:hypothetical protein
MGVARSFIIRPLSRALISPIRASICSSFCVSRHARMMPKPWQIRAPSAVSIVPFSYGADKQLRVEKAHIGYHCGGTPAKSLTTATRASGPTFTVPANG